MRNILERDLKSREREVEFLKNENLKLKEGEMGLKGHSVRYAEG